MDAKTAARKIKAYRIKAKKDLQATASLGVGMVASSVRGTLNTSDFLFKKLMPMLSPNSTFMSSVDDMAGHFGGMTDHTVGDELLKYILKATIILYGLTSKTLRFINDGTEKVIKNEFLLAQKANARQR
ncbi:MAG: hypothetical protein E7013_01380 [Alphaproteobacteria bacterium]|nr:hypothetical protein [Alphaproteobacteria bacterium]